MSGFKRMLLKMTWGLMPEIEKHKYVWAQMRKGGKSRTKPEPGTKRLVLESDLS